MTNTENIINVQCDSCGFVAEVETNGTDIYADGFEPVAWDQEVIQFKVPHLNTFKGDCVGTITVHRENI